MSHPTDGPIEFGSHDGTRYRIIRDPSGRIEFVELGRDPEHPPPPTGPAPDSLADSPLTSILLGPGQLYWAPLNSDPDADHAAWTRLGTTSPHTLDNPWFVAQISQEWATPPDLEPWIWSEVEVPVTADTESAASALEQAITAGESFLMDSGVPVSISTDALFVVIGTGGPSLDPEAFLQRVDELAAEQDRAREPEFDLYISDWAEWDTPWGAAQWTADPADHNKLSSLGLSGRWLTQSPTTGDIWRYEPGELEWDLPFRSPCP
jgi:hypothetical protein